MKTKIKKDEWDAINYPELSQAENDEIRLARRKGFAYFYPMYPSAAAQSFNTLAGARTFMKEYERPNNSYVVS